jgi:hypothetical protein
MLLEQNDPAGAARVQEILRAANVRDDELIYFQPKKPDLVLGPALIEALEKEITENNGSRDIYTSLRPSRKGGVDIVKADHEDMTTLDELGKRTNSILLLLHHESHTGAMRHWTSSSAGTYGMTMALGH